MQIMCCILHMQVLLEWLFAFAKSDTITTFQAFSQSPQHISDPKMAANIRKYTNVTSPCNVNIPYP